MARACQNLSMAEAREPDGPPPRTRTTRSTRSTRRRRPSASSRTPARRSVGSARGARGETEATPAILIGGLAIWLAVGIALIIGLIVVVTFLVVARNGPPAVSTKSPHDARPSSIRVAYALGMDSRRIAVIEDEATIAASVAAPPPPRASRWTSPATAPKASSPCRRVRPDLVVGSHAPGPGRARGLPADPARPRRPRADAHRPRLGDGSRGRPRWEPTS